MLPLHNKRILITRTRHQASDLATELEALGAVSRSLAVAAELREIAEARWGTSDQTRSAAATAAGLIAKRFDGRGSSLPGAASSGGGPVGAAS